jgi:UDP-glucose 4-epimerase
MHDFSDAFLKNHFSDKHVLITGGLGFLGSNVANRLVTLGASVIILDSLHPSYGGNEHNIDPINKNNIQVVIGDVRNKALIESLVKSADVIYHFAAQVSYIDSANMPFEDLEVNLLGTLNILETCRHINPSAKILFASSRLVIGASSSQLINEEHPTHPLSIYGVHKLAAEKYFSIYHHNYGSPTTVLRITNPYGPRQQIKHNKYSIVGWFIRLAMEGKELTIFGDGQQLRNYIYVEDIVDAFIRCGATPRTNGQLYFVGSKENIEFREMTKLVIETVGNGTLRHVPWPSNYEHVETGDVNIDTTKLRKEIGWDAQCSLKDGIIRTIEYYSRHWRYYVSKKTKPLNYR